MINNKIRLIKSLFVPLCIFLISIGLLSTISFYTYEYSHFEKLTKKVSTKTATNFKKKFDNDIKNYEELIKLISKDTKAITLYKEENRLGLYNYYKELYESWKVKYKISHFYFHKTNKINFLRVHNYKQSNDLINRITLDNSINSKGLGAGIEFGIAHNLTLRVVYPWFENNKIIGYIELGKEIDYFTPELAKLNDVDVLFTIKKDLISKEDYKKWLDYSKNNLKFKELKNYFIIDSTIKDFDVKLLDILDEQKNHINIKISNFEKQYYINSKDFIDANNKIIGKILILHDVTNDMENFNSLMIKITLFIILLTLLLLSYYFRLIKTEEESLISNHNEIVNLSIKDSLTNIYNRRYFDIYFDEIIKNNRVTNNYVTLIMADIDNFKKYNDKYGHQKGDEALIQVAKGINECLNRFSDKCFRIGGEEFAVLLVSTKIDIGIEYAKKIKSTIEELNIPHLNNEDFNKVTLSIGVLTIKVNEKTNKNRLYKIADKLLYKSKKSGRNKISYQEIK